MRFGVNLAQTQGLDTRHLKHGHNPGLNRLLVFHHLQGTSGMHEPSEELIQQVG